MIKIFITGAAGFIGMHLAQKLHNEGHKVIGIDNFNNYYDTALKYKRCDNLLSLGIEIEDVDLKDKQHIESILRFQNPDLIIHLAAHAGVRHSMDNAMAYIENNIIATQNLIDVCEGRVNKIIYASTSCVMAGQDLPWSEKDNPSHQLNPYGYTKRTNECQFITSKILHTIGLRFFTVYGPWGRPDMALFKFSEAAVKDNTIDVYNNGQMLRDFTYIDDIIEGINIIVNHILSIENNKYNQIYNIGRGEQIHLMDFIEEIENNFNREIKKNYVDAHPADTIETLSDTTKLQGLGWAPKISIKEGVFNFVKWYKDYYGYN